MSGGAGATLHASAIAMQGQAVLIVGPSGSGKTALALEMLALGAGLVADDRTCLAVRDGELVASAPAALAGLIEARGIGILRAPPLARATVRLIADLGEPPNGRLPPAATRRIEGVDLPLLRLRGLAHPAPALWLYLAGGPGGDR